MNNNKQKVIDAVKKELDATFDVLDLLRTKILNAETDQEKAKYTAMYKQLQEKKAELQKVFKGYLMNN